MRIRLGRIVVLIAILCPVAAAADGAHAGARTAPKTTDRDAIERAAREGEYRVLKTELRLADTGRPYLVIDIPGGRLLIKQGGAVMWDCPLEREADSGSAAAFAAEFVGDGGRIFQPVRGRHLYAFKERSPDSVLAIVSEVVHAKTDLMQRIIPGRFSISWKDGATLEVRTDAPCKPRSRLGNILEGIRLAVRQRGNGARLVVRMDAERAVTLYRVAERGLPTLIYAQ